jgi:hypothetical protein
MTSMETANHNRIDKLEVTRDTKETQRYLASRPQRFQFVFVQARFVAQSDGEYVQQDGAQHAPGDPGADQTGTHRANPPVLPRSECSSGGIPMEV